MSEFLTQYYYIRLVFRKHGLKENEHFMYGLLNVCRLTGDDPEQVVSFSLEEEPVYSRHLWYWLMKRKGYSETAIGRVMKKDRSGVAKGIERIDRDSKSYDNVTDHVGELSK